MRRDEPPHYYAIEHKGGAIVVCDTQRHTEYGGVDGHWARSPAGVQPYATFDDANRAVKQFREEQSGYFGPRERNG